MTGPLQTTTALKRCPGCDEWKDRVGFSKDASKKDGYACWCKKCNGRRNRAYCAKDHVKRRKTIQKRNYYWKDPDKHRSLRRIYRSNDAPPDPEKQRTRRLTREYVKKGILVRPDKCQKCQKAGPVEAHHPDYSKPKLVVWVCRLCHGAIHRRYK